MESGGVRTPPPKGSNATFRQRGRRLAVGAAAAVLLTIWFARAPLLCGVARFLNVGQPPQQVDYMMVLGGDRDVRPFVAAAWWKAGWARAVLVPGVTPHADSRPDEPLEEEILLAVLLHRGVPRTAVQVLPGACVSTRDEGRALARFLARQPGRPQVAVVTSMYHTRRARRIFRRELGEAADQIVFVSAPTDAFDETNWWRFEQGIRIYALEYGKLLYSLIY